MPSLYYLSSYIPPNDLRSVSFTSIDVNDDDHLSFFTIRCAAAYNRVGREGEEEEDIGRGVGVGLRCGGKFCIDPFFLFLLLLLSIGLYISTFLSTTIVLVVVVSPAVDILVFVIVAAPPVVRVCLNCYLGMTTATTIPPPPPPTNPLGR